MTLRPIPPLSHNENMSLMRILKKTIPSMIKMEVRGGQHIPATGPALLVGDHPNILDGLLLAVVSPRPVRILVAAELCRSKVVAKIIDQLGWLPVERHESGKNGDTMKACREALERGEVVAVFPEGKTNYGGELLPFKAGAALLAHASGAPVVPFSIYGSEKLYPDGSKVFHTGRAAISFGAPESFERLQGRLPEGVVDSTLGTMKDRVEALRGPLRNAKVGRGLPLQPGSLMGSVVVKMLSLALLTVDWSRR